MTTHPAIRGTYSQPTEADCHAAGYKAFVLGRSAMACPYPLNSAERRAWLNGWSEAKRDDRRTKR